MNKEYDEAKYEILYRLRLAKSHILLLKKATSNIEKKKLKQLLLSAELNLEKIKNGKGLH